MSIQTLTAKVKAGNGTVKWVVFCWRAGQATGGKFFRLVFVGSIGAVDTGKRDNGASGEPKVLTGGRF